MLRNRLTGSVPWSALGAESTENQFTFAKHAFPKRTGSRSGHLAPLDVLDIAAAVADEVMMPQAFRIEARGTAFDGDFPH